ncbi:MAG: hypothetical protein M3Z46_11730 [Actinomycetota bacterium]|nr:hypothetical protein [Actinomycetota bacterium]
MRALWVAPPVVLLTGSVAAGVQLRRIASQGVQLAAEARAFASDRIELGALRRATGEVRATLEDLERR